MIEIFKLTDIENVLLKVCTVYKRFHKLAFSYKVIISQSSKILKKRNGYIYELSK